MPEHLAAQTFWNPCLFPQTMRNFLMFIILFVTSSPHSLPPRPLLPLLSALPLPSSPPLLPPPHLSLSCPPSLPPPHLTVFYSSLHLPHSFLSFFPLLPFSPLFVLSPLIIPRVVLRHPFSPHPVSFVPSFLSSVTRLSFKLMIRLSLIFFFLFPSYLFLL